MVIRTNCTACCYDRHVVHKNNKTRRRQCGGWLKSYQRVKYQVPVPPDACMPYSLLACSTIQYIYDVCLRQRWHQMVWSWSLKFGASQDACVWCSLASSHVGKPLPTTTRVKQTANFYYLFGLTAILLRDGTFEFEFAWWGIGDLVPEGLQTGKVKGIKQYKIKYKGLVRSSEAKFYNFRCLRWKKDWR